MKINHFIALFIAVTLNAVLIAAPVEPVRTMMVPYASSAPFLDGLMDDCYGELQTTEYGFPDQQAGYGGESDFRADFAVCWDENYFCIYTEITDDIDHSYEWDFSEPWYFDNYNIYFQLDTNTMVTTYDEHTVQLRICRGLDSIEYPGRTERADYIYFMESQSADGWITEIAIPWTAVLGEGEGTELDLDYSGVAIGYDFDAGDSDNSDGDETQGNRDYQTFWDLDGQDGTEDLAWMNTSLFGYIELALGEVSPKPFANAGPDQEVMEGEIVSLDATGSGDPEGGDISYT
jgi:hypothetical protein